MRLTQTLRKVAAAVLVAGATSAIAAPISVGFNFIPFGGTLTGNLGDITTSTAVTFAGGTYVINGVDAVNTLNTPGVALFDVITMSNPVPLTLGAEFTKEFTAGGFTYTETLMVTDVTTGPGSRSILASGTISCAGCGFDPTNVFFSGAFTQNGGPTAQINGSFNNSTVPPTTQVPEPASLALAGLALAGLGLTTRRRKA